MVWLRLLGLVFLVAYSFSMGQIPPSGLNPFGKFVATLFFLAAPALYMLPTLEAWLRKHPNLGALAALNVLLGWTLVGWVAALVWALLKSGDGAKAPPAAPAEPPVARPWPPAQHRVPTAPPPAPTTKDCPYCAEPVLLAAIKCKHCGSEIPATTATGTP